MIANLCFLQYTTVAHRSSSPSVRAGITDQKTQTRIMTGTAICLAVALNLAGLYGLPQAEKQPKITPPKPIMINWINAAESKKATPTPAVARQSKPEPKKDTPKPVAKKIVTPKPLITSSQDSITAPQPIADPEPPKSAESSSAPTQAAPIEAKPSASDASDQQAALTLPSLNADYLNNPAPAYPEEARRQGEQGRVLVRVLVNTLGTVDQIMLRKSSGYPQLDQSAIDTVKTWRFVPAQRAGGSSVAAWVVVPILFSLEG